ncbi:MAG TPA: hypothetical protein DEV93_14600 [Chloroflexi bacterium]|jgi:hypothetical protein|nr:hypothetical protein [Chloroflexota bacterium]
MPEEFEEAEGPSEEAALRDRGPEGWENWRAFLDRKAAQDAWEVALYTDSQVVGSIDALGPYRLLNTVPATWRADPGHSELAIILRVDGHDDFEPEHSRADWETAELGSYHGGTLGDEIAALVSLVLGIRLQAGGMTRAFESDGDPRGTPHEFAHRRPRLIPPQRGQPSVLPRIAVEQARLEDAKPRLQTYPTLQMDNATALVRAARQFQRGLWNADADPGLAWLESVSAIEVAAAHWREYGEGYERIDVLERVRRYAPNIIDAVEVAGEQVARRVASAVAHLVKSTDRFVQFLEAFSPARPEPRPTHFALDWANLRPAFIEIYKRRSDALHGGKPIPWPMTHSPRETSNGAFEEHSGGLGSWSGNAYWPANETPMYLNTFVYIVRGTLLNWWGSMLQPSSQ